MFHSIGSVLHLKTISDRLKKMSYHLFVYELVVSHSALPTHTANNSYGLHLIPPMSFLISVLKSSCHPLYPASSPPKLSSLSYMLFRVLPKKRFIQDKWLGISTLFIMAFPPSTISKLFCLFTIINLTPNKKQPRGYTHLGLFFTDLYHFRIFLNQNE